MVKIPKVRDTARFRAVMSKFEHSMTTVCAELVADLMAEGWTQGEAEAFMKELTQGINFDLPPKGSEEIADEFLYGQGDGGGSS